MATILKPVRLVNPGKVKRRMTAKQKLFFGSKRQRAAVKRSLHNGRRTSVPGANSKYPRKVRKSRSTAQSMYHLRKHNIRWQERANKKRNRPSSRLPNVGEIITIRPLVNSGTKEARQSKIARIKRARKRRNPSNMAKSAKRRAAGLKAARTRKRNKAARSHSRRSSHRRRNPGVVHHRRRRYARRTGVVRHRRSYARVTRRHRNPGFTSGMGGSFGKVIGVIGGAMLTKTISGMLPSSLTTGVLGYLSIGIVAMLQGKAVGKILKNPTLGNDMAIGGYTYLALRVAQDYFPSLGIGLSGMGLIGGSSFYVPQVNQPGSMGNFMLPAAVAGAIPPAVVAGGMKGLGAGTSMRRVGRLR